MAYYLVCDYYFYYLFFVRVIVWSQELSLLKKFIAKKKKTLLTLKIKILINGMFLCVLPIS